MNPLATQTHNRLFDAQGHRGARGLMPENTLPAFEYALRLGVTTLELDCGVTRDGVVVVCHDQALNPDIARLDGEWLDGSGPLLIEHDYADLLRYDLGAIRPGSAYANRFPDQTAVDGVQLPRLADVFSLATAAGDRRVRFNIETKIDPEKPDHSLGPEPFAQALIDVVVQAGIAERTTIQSFDWRTLAIVQQQAAEIPTVYLSTRQAAGDTIRSPGPSPWTNGLAHARYGSVAGMVRAAGGRIWSPDYRDLNAATLREAQARGLTVIPWTVNDPSDMRRAIEWGADGLITDYPDRLMALLPEYGLRAR